MAVLAYPSALTSLQAPDEARRVLIYPADIGCPKREAPWGVLASRRGNCILLRTACEAGFLEHG